ncbi:hypothetical protein [Legionella waltersii]|uniref:Uncharacterized protein n=1 Tax=Legionella waltersii TaxID=66969 RepID=A0A0W1A1N5_9GAMM|nr:hypothetical protein [Legionella waltersii]KTD75259.1 hypothetical protein Lwal_3300 [Legionella waltersii]SNV06766.1 Uncharacterised protein [Legionella waltersii]
MAGAKGKFTDNQLKLFLGQLLKHYQYCIKKEGGSLTIHEVYDELFKATQYALESPNGYFYHLDKQEKEKVYAYFEAIFRSTPLFTSLPVQKQYSFKPNRISFNASSPFTLNEYNNYFCDETTSMSWSIVNAIAYHCHKMDLYVRNKQPSAKNDQEESDENGSAWMIILVIIGIAAFGAVLTIASLYYMFHHFLEGTERMWYGEGWVKAALMMASTLGFGGASAGLMIGFATPILTTLAISAGLNPLIAIIVVTTCVSIIGAGIASLGLSVLYDLIDKRIHSSSMDPCDPYRFRLTEEDEKRLLEKHIDPIKVKCAMIALRSEIAKQLGSDEEMPSFLSRHLGEGRKIQGILNQVRELRSGNATVIHVGDLSFDCRIPVVTEFNSLLQVYRPLPYSYSTSQNVVVEQQESLTSSL